MATNEAETPDETMTAETDGDATDEAPDIEEDLLQEELRIDGICGVY
jgi:mycofactocin precursor